MQIVYSVEDGEAPNNTDDKPEDVRWLDAAKKRVDQTSENNSDGGRDGAIV